MRFFLSLLLAASLAMPAAKALAKEPANLATCKQAVERYYNSGEYLKDITTVTDNALSYLKSRLASIKTEKKKLAIVLDIDETSLSNYPHLLKLDFGGTRNDILRSLQDGTDLAIQPTLSLYRFAREKGLAVFFITGRPPALSKATESNLRKAGYTYWDGLFFMPAAFNYQSVAVFKTNVRKQLTDLGYRLIINVGDQESDLAGGYADKTFKIPNPFYFIP